MNIAAENVEVEVPHGTSRLAGSENVNRFVETEYQSKLLTEIIQTFAVGELCLVGKEFWFSKKCLGFRRNVRFS